MRLRRETRSNLTASFESLRMLASASGFCLALFISHDWTAAHHISRATSLDDNRGRCVSRKPIPPHPNPLPPGERESTEVQPSPARGEGARRRGNHSGGCGGDFGDFHFGGQLVDVGLFADVGAVAHCGCGSGGATQAQGVVDGHALLQAEEKPSYHRVA